MSAKGGSSQWWRVWFAPQKGGQAHLADVKVSYFVWNLISGARLSTWPAPGTRTPARVAVRIVTLLGLGLVAAAVVDGARRTGGEWWTVDGLGQLLTDAADRQAAERPWLPPALWVAAAVALAAAGWHATAWALDQPFYDRWIDPTHKAICRDVWGVPPERMPAKSYLHVPRDFADAPEGIRVRAPVDIKPGNDRKVIEDKVIERLPTGGAGEVNAVWITKGPHCFLQITARAKLPKRVAYVEPAVAAEVGKSTSGHSFLGMTRGSNPYRADLDTETPHLLFSAGTGGGKSTAAKVIAAQEMHNGAGLLILDAVKRKSHRWARVPGKWRKSIPGVIYCRDVPHAHRMLVALGREVSRRQEASEELPDGVELDDPRVVVICEELNATMRKLKDYWRRIKNDADLAGEHMGEPHSPAVIAYEEALLMGRAERTNVIAVAQMGTVRALGSSEARENYGFRGLSRFSSNAKRMLIPDVGAEFRSSTDAGRWVIAKGDEAADVQVMWWEDQDARAWAMSGVPSKLPFSTRTDPAADSQPTLHVVRDGQTQEPRSLREMSYDHGDKAVPDTFEVLKQARYRHEETFPRPVGRRGVTLLYDVGEVQRWSAARRAEQVDLDGEEVPT